ncbi:MAG: hypothetical protein WDM91_11075 [Rhizomicrobium sp.]
MNRPRRRIVIDFAAPKARPRRRTRRQQEQQLQIALVKVLALALTPATRFFHVPNGGFRTKAEAGILKAMGVIPGMHDLVLLHRLQFGDLVVCGAYGLELKSDDGDVTETQSDLHADVATIGMPTAVAHTIDEAIDAIRSWGIPLRIKDERRAAA